MQDIQCFQCQILSFADSVSFLIEKNKTTKKQKQHFFKISREAKRSKESQSAFTPSVLIVT